MVLPVRLGDKTHDRLLLIWVIGRLLLCDFVDEIVLRGVVGQLITDSPDYAFDTLVEGLHKGVAVDLVVYLVALALIKHLCDIRIILNKVLSRLPVVQEDQHIGHALLQLAGRVVMTMLGLRVLLLVLLFALILLLPGVLLLGFLCVVGSARLIVFAVLAMLIVLLRRLSGLDVLPLRI